MKTLVPNTYTGERACYSTHDFFIKDCIFEDGESPLKESSDLHIVDTEFRWKYPLWYCHNVLCENVKITLTARSGIWYTKNIIFKNSIIDAPKTFRKSSDIVLENTDLLNAEETLWNCRNIKLKNVKAKGNYFCLNGENIEIDHLELDGNYAFDGGKNIVIKNSTLMSKDSFWNCENVVLINCKVVGEYLAWNSKNITFIDCELESNQGLCYMSNVKLVNTKLENTDLCFELCSDIDAEITSHVVSIKNPISGKIVVKSVGELILDEKIIDKSKTEIVIEDEKI